MLKKYLFSLLAFAVLMSACKDDELGPVLQNGSGLALTSPAANAAFVLTEADADKVFSKFTWSAAEYGFDAAVVYTLELDKAGNDFKEPATVGTTNGLELTDVTVSKINTLLIAAKSLPGEESSDVQFRVKAVVSADVAPLYSQPVTLKITPYTVVIIYPQLQVPGSYQGWNPGDNTTVIFSAKSDGKYEGYAYFADPGTKFKFTQGPTWDKNWGDTGPDGKLDPNGTDIAATDAGLHKLNVNLNDLTYSVAKTSWGLIGDATPDGWNSDQDLTYDASAGKLSVTLNLVGGKKMKFRANDDWAVNLGDDGANKTLEYGGADINGPAADGNYTVDLFLNKAVYTYKITKN